MSYMHICSYVHNLHTYIHVNIVQFRLISLKYSDTIDHSAESIEVGDRREWLLFGVADKRQLGTPERVREKIDRVEQRSSGTEEDAEEKATKEEIRALLLAS